MIVLKLGGALITDKRKGVFDRAKLDVINRIAKEIAESKVRDIVIVHGAGSFGHPYVEKYGINPEGISKTHLACERLCCIVCESLIKAGLNPLPIHPANSFRLRGEKIEFEDELFENTDLIPVTHGDVVKSDSGWKVLSGDDIAVELALRFKAERLGFATNTEIVLNGEKLEVFSLKKINELKNVNFNNKTSDVTGGMVGKLEKVKKVADRSKVFIFSGLKKGNISAFLSGANVGTKVLP